MVIIICQWSYKNWHYLKTFAKHVYIGAGCNGVDLHTFTPYLTFTHNIQLQNFRSDSGKILLHETGPL